MKYKVFEELAKKSNMLIAFIPDFRLRLLHRLIALSKGKIENIDPKYLDEHPYTRDYIKLLKRQPCENENVLMVHQILQVQKTKVFLESLMLCDNSTDANVLRTFNISEEVLDFYKYLVFDDNLFNSEINILGYLETINDKDEHSVKSLAYKYGYQIVKELFRRNTLDKSLKSMANAIARDASVKALHSSLFSYDSEEASKASAWGSKAMSYIAACRSSFKDNNEKSNIQKIIENLKLTHKNTDPNEELKQINPDFKIE